MTNSQDWERRRNRWADYKAQQENKTMIFDETRENTVAKETQQREADDRADFDESEDDGQPDEYTEWQDYMGGDDWDQGQYDCSW